MLCYDVIKKPVLTEKALADDKIVFVISTSANKKDVKQAIEKIYPEAKVSKVNIINVKGKAKRFKGKIGKRSNLKKAIVTLEDPSVVDVISSVK